MTNLWLVTFSWTLFPFLLIPFNTWPFLFFRFFWGLVGCPLPFPVNSFSPQRRWPFVLVLHGFWFLVYFIATYLVFICEPSPLSWCHFHLCELRVFFVFCFILISSPLPFPQNSFPFFRSFYSSASVRTFLSPIPRWFYSSPILISLARTDHWWCRILCGRFTGNASSWKERSERGEGRFKQRAVGSDNRRWSTDPVRHAAPTTSIDTFTCVASSCLLPGSAGCDVHYFPIFFSLFPYHFPNVVFLVQQRIPHMDPHLLPPFLRNEMFPLSSVHLPPFKILRVFNHVCVLVSSFRELLAKHFCIVNHLQMPLSWMKGIYLHWRSTCATPSFRFVFSRTSFVVARLRCCPPQYFILLMGGGEKVHTRLDWEMGRREREEKRGTILEYRTIGCLFCLFSMNAFYFGVFLFTKLYFLAYLFFCPAFHRLHKIFLAYFGFCSCTSYCVLFAFIQCATFPYHEWA